LVDFSIPVEVFIYILDLFGTMAFAVTGAFKAIEKKSDIIGIIFLATITGVAGGTIRDVVLGRSPPNSIVDPVYVGITVVTAVIMFFLFSKLKKHWNVFLKFDAIGLGVFTVIGATFAYNLFGLNYLVIVFAGILTAIGGGILRDVIVNEMPIVFVKELYAFVSFIGASIFFVILAFGGDIYLATSAGAISATGLRLVAMKYNWNLPKVRGNI